MNSTGVQRLADVGHTRSAAQAVYGGRTLLGFVHATPRGFVAENAAGKKIGNFRKSADAAHAIVLAAEPPE
jgi:hypothetical protein